MNKKYFLKLDSVRGDSQSPRHYGEIEIYAFSWGGKHPNGISGGPGKASISDFTIAKKNDRSSPILWVAWQNGQLFKEGVLTIEELADRGSLVSSSIVELRSLQIDSMLTSDDDETLTFNFDNMKIKRG